MRSSSEDGKSHVQQWLKDGFERGKFRNDPRPVASVNNQDKADDEYEEAQEETEHNSPKELSELEDRAEDRDGRNQKTGLDKASHPKIYNTNPKPMPATTGSRHTSDNDGRDDHTEDGPAPKIFVTVNIIPTLGPMPPRESPSAGYKGGGRKDEQRQSNQIGSKLEEDNRQRTVKEIPDNGRGPTFKHPSPPRTIPIRATTAPVVAPAPPYKGKDEQRQSNQIGSKLEEDNRQRTVKEIPDNGRGPTFKHPSPPRTIPIRATTAPVVAPAPPYKGKKEEKQSPPPCRCVVL